MELVAFGGNAGIGNADTRNSLVSVAGAFHSYSTGRVSAIDTGNIAVSESPSKGGFMFVSSFGV